MPGPTSDDASTDNHPLDEPPVPETGATARRYARDAWLHRRVLDHVDMDVGGAYTWDPDDYAPIPVVQDGETGLVFAKT